MLDDKICQLREKLNHSIEIGADYELIYILSVQLDELIAEYYRNDEATQQKSKRKTKEKIV